MSCDGKNGTWFTWGLQVIGWEDINIITYSNCWLDVICRQDNMIAYSTWGLHVIS